MSKFDLKYGRETVQMEVQDCNLLGVLKSREIPCAASEEEAVLAALENPIASPRLRDKVKPGERVCIVTCDITRAWQHPNLYLTILVDELQKAGVRDEDIFFICGIGTHRGQTPEEHKLLLGEKLYSRYKIYDHDSRAKDVVSFGVTSRGTPVKINRMAAEADHLILTGGIVYHFMAGWGGGRKCVLPSISSYETVMANHALTLKLPPERGRNMLCRAGYIENNPLHLDMVEAASLVSPSFLLNVIMNASGKIGWAVAGHWQQAHEHGMKIVDSIDAVEIHKKADLVVASACGFPKDISFYQATKTIFNAEEAVKEGGAIIVLAECSEGYGNNEVQMMLQRFKNSAEREEELRRDFTIAKHVGYCAGQTAEEFDFHLVTKMTPALLLGTGIQVSASVDEALKKIYARHGTSLKTWMMPQGANTLPKLV